MPPKKDVPKKDAPKKDGKDRPKQEPPKQEPPKKYVPGAVYASDDEKDKGAKQSRRRKKSGSKDEPAEAGPSSRVASPPPALPGYGAGSSSAKPPASTGTVQSPASAGARQHPQVHSQAASATTSSSRPAQPSAQSDNGQTGQPRKDLPVAEGSTKEQATKTPTNTTSQAGPSRDVDQQQQKRPGGGGTQGTQVFLSTNYFKLEVKKDLKLYRYSVKVSPEAKGRKLAQTIKDALNLPEFDAYRPGLVSDFAAVLLSPQQLEDNLLKVSVPYKKSIAVEDMNDSKSLDSTKDSNAAESPSRYHVTFDFIRVVDINNDPSTYGSSVDQGDLPVVQDLDIVLGHYRKSAPNISMIGKRRAFYMGESDVQSLLLGATEDVALLAAVRGYFSSVRLSTDKILVNINVTHGAFYLERQLSAWWNLVQRYSRIHVTKLPSLLKGLRVEIRYLPNGPVVKTISGCAASGQGVGYEFHPPMVTEPAARPQRVSFFEYKSKKPTMGQKDKEAASKGRLASHDRHHCGCNGSYTSVSDYFKRRYPSLPISDDQPVVNVGSAQHPSYLPLSVCYLLVQPAKVKLGPNEMKLMQTFAVRIPAKNAESINQCNPTLGLSGTHLTTLGLSVDVNKVTLFGRVLPRPTVMYAKKPANYLESQWNLRGIKFHDRKELTSWACLNIYYRQKPQTCHYQCLRNFMAVLTDCGITHSQPISKELSINRVNTELEGVFNSLAGIQVLLVVLPNDNSQLYNRVKQLGDVKHGIQTVCVLGESRKFYNTAVDTAVDGAQRLRSIPYNANVALKVNIKNGGINHVLKHGQLGFINKGTTMVVGIDVTHPSPGSGPRAPSVAAMVASSDENLAQWPAEIRVNPARQEKVDTLRSMLQEHLVYWYKKHEEYPEKLLIYRDGVSEGQYQMVLDEELPQLRAACKLVYGEKKPPCITLIVVGKRHHTRFYKTDRRTKFVLGTKAGNPSYGTVVDTEIVDTSRNWDFYLQSHTALAGTARPAHYFVLWDEIFKALSNEELRPFQNASDYLYSITYNMCYLFCRATMSVSIPPPVYYADIACERGRRWNSRVFDATESEGSGSDELQDRDVTVHDNLKKTMFYV